MSGSDRLTPEGKKFFKEMEKLAKMKLRVGFQHGQATTDDGADIADVAMWNELGTANSPARPFLRQSVERNEDKIKAMCQQQLEAVATGQTDAKGALNAIGVMQKALVQESIRNGDFEPNAPSTIAKKGSSKPLIESGRMRQSVTFIIEEGG